MSSDEQSSRSTSFWPGFSCPLRIAFRMLAVTRSRKEAYSRVIRGIVVIFKSVLAFTFDVGVANSHGREHAQRSEHPTRVLAARLADYNTEFYERYGAPCLHRSRCAVHAVHATLGGAVYTGSGSVDG